jgi:hypothetical protein
MKSLVRKIFEQVEPSLEPYVYKLFRFLNEEKQKHKTRAALLDVIKNISPYMGVPKGYEIYLLELYLLNYRKDGNYKNLTKENFVDPRKMKGKWTSNTKADLYTIAQLPFKGSNLEGYWSEDNKGVPYYVVKSYNWYPIYIYKNGVWYEAANRYSSSTGRQMSNANPIEWSEELHEKVYLVTEQEMRMLQLNATHQDIIDNKRKSIKSQEGEFQKKRLASASQYRSWWDENDRITPYKVKFKINSIDDSGEKVIVNVDVYDVLKMEDSKQIATPENYLKGELPGVTKDKVEKTLMRKLNHDMRPYIGPRYTYNDPLPQSSVIEYKFNHLKK